MFPVAVYNDSTTFNFKMIVEFRSILPKKINQSEYFFGTMQEKLFQKQNQTKTRRFHLALVDYYKNENKALNSFLFCLLFGVIAK